jgi:hypothetical protein
MKLFLVLSQKNLDIYKDKIDFENLVSSCENIYQTGQISERFEEYFTKIYQPLIVDCDEIELVLQVKAGFTNTRIIAVWCRSWALFCDKKFVISKDGIVQENIIYSSLPNIGAPK